MRNLDKAIRMLDDWMSPKAIEHRIEQLGGNAYRNVPDAQMKKEIVHLDKMIDLLYDYKVPHSELQRLEGMLRTFARSKGINY